MAHEGMNEVTRTPRSETERLTVGQALIRFMLAQYAERDGRVTRFFGGALGIFGHGNVAGVGQALLQYQDEFRYFQPRNEQGAVHIATGYAKARNRLGAMAVTTSVGPGASNMVTGAATATINHLPVLLLPGDNFATRRTGAVLQQIESPWSWDQASSDSFKAVSRYFDRINRPEQLPTALVHAMRTLTSPSDTGAVTLALPQDVQAEAWDFPSRLFEQRVWHVPRARADRAALARAVAAIMGAERPLVIAGGGVVYAEATAALVQFAEATGIGVGVTQAGKAGFPHDHALALGAIGASGSRHANGLAESADLVIGIGTRYTDFTTASNTLFQNEAVTFVNINVAELDALKESAIALVGDARETLTELSTLLGSHAVDAGYRAEVRRTASAWRAEVDELTASTGGGTLSQAEVVGIVNAAAGPRDVVVNAAGSLPGDLHRLWRAGGPQGYDMEYGNSCMGYEVAGAVGAKLGDPDREVFAMVGDGSWLMMHQEIVTAIQEGLKITVVLVDNEGYGSIAALSRTLGSQGFGTRFTRRGDDGRHSGPRLQIDLPGGARSYGAEVYEASTADGLEAALGKAASSNGTTVIYVKVDSQARFGGSGAWWEVPVAEVSELVSSREARAAQVDARRHQADYL